MAINFLNNISLNSNEIQNVIIQRLASDPTGVAGRIIYNNSTNTIKYYNGTGWIELDGLGGISGSGTVNTLPIFKTNSTTLADSVFAQDSGATEGKVTGGFQVTGYFKDSGGDKGNAGQLLSSTGTATDWINAPDSYTKWIAASGTGGTADVLDGDKYIINRSTTQPGIVLSTASKLGTTITQELGLYTKSMTVASPSAYSTDVILWGTNTTATAWKVQQTHIEDIPVSAWGDATSTIDMGGKKIIDLADPTVAQDAATKTYVDSAVAGGLNVKGGFNADTGVIGGSPSPGNLTEGEERVAIAIGDYYVVTTAGDFFGQGSTPLTVGDSVLVQTAAAIGTSVEGDFAVIQSDTDLATLTTVGIGNVNKSGDDVQLGILVDYATGTAKVGLGINDLTSIATAVADTDELLIVDLDGDPSNKPINRKVAASVLKTYFAGDTTALGVNLVLNSALDGVTKSASGTAPNITTIFAIDVTNATNAFGSGVTAINVKAEVLTSAGETVYPSVTRSGNTLSVTFLGASVADSVYRVLLVNVG